MQLQTTMAAPNCALVLPCTPRKWKGYFSPQQSSCVERIVIVRQLQGFETVLHLASHNNRACSATRV